VDNSASSHGRQASTSEGRGFLSSRRLPREQLARRPDKWPALNVFFIARLFADHNDPRPARPLAQDSLGRVAIQIAATAFLHRCPKSRQRWM